jgi:hypothetical protein
LTLDGDKNGNGEHGVTHTPLDTLVLTYDRARDMLEIGGKCNSLDLMLDMLGRATRVLEGKLRAENAIALQNQLRQAAIDRQIADSLRNGR